MRPGEPTPTTDSRSSVTATRSGNRPPYFLIGVLLFIAGPVVYYFQFQRAMLWTPWYIPILGLVGLVWMGMSLRRHPGWGRGIVFAAFLLFCAFEWFLLGVAVKNPQYTGPAQAHQPVPTFATTRANGEPFTDRELADGTRSLLVFFRGRW